VRTVILGGPGSGKSTLATELSAGAVPVFCGDPASKAKVLVDGVNYLPEGIPFAGDDGAAAWIAGNWFTMPGPWILEGHVMARALRRWARDHYNGVPCDRIIVLTGQHRADPLKGQLAMGKAVATVWAEISWRFATITEERP
jgi:hypothetical protein